MASDCPSQDWEPIVTDGALPCRLSTAGIADLNINIAGYFCTKL